MGEIRKAKRKAIIKNLSKIGIIVSQHSSLKELKELAEKKNLNINNLISETRLETFYLKDTITKKRAVQYNSLKRESSLENKMQLSEEHKKLLEEKLQNYKDSLLDLSSRNKMINSSFGSRVMTHFRLIDEIPQYIFEGLENNKSFSFAPLPPEKEPEDEKTSKFLEEYEIQKYVDEDYILEMEEIDKKNSDDPLEDQLKAERKLKDKIRKNLGMPSLKEIKKTPREHAKENNINPDFDLKYLSELATNPSTKKDKELQTIYFEDLLNRIQKNIYQKYQKDMKEFGVNSLYFCFGFLQWQESSSSNDFFRSPILLLHSEMEKTRNNKYYVGSSGDGLILNPTLAHRLKRDFNIILPEVELNLDDEESAFKIDDYLKNITNLINKTKPNWKVRNWVAFGSFQVGEMAIYNDIESIEKGEKSNLLVDILIGSSNDSSYGGGEYDVDHKKHKDLVPMMIEPYDSSQFSAIIDVINNKNLVISGPPGTGKSQTITNIIAALISSGKKVLFVAQKQAALNVVRNRLESAGLSEYLLEIFSTKANKKSVFESFNERIDKGPPRSQKRELEARNQEYYEKKLEINKYKKFINTTIGESENSIHDLLWEMSDFEYLDFEIPTELKDFEVPNSENISNIKLDSLLRELQLISDLYSQLFSENNLNDNVMKNIKNHNLEKFEIEKIEGEIIANNKELKDFDKKLDEIFKQNNSIKDIKLNFFENNKLLIDWLDNTESPNENNTNYWKLFNLVLEVRDSKFISEYLKYRDNFFSESNDFQELKEEMSSIFNYEETLFSQNEIKNASKILTNTNIFSIFSSEFRKSNSIFNSIYLGPKVKRSKKWLKLRELTRFMESALKKEENLEKKEKELEKKYNEVQKISNSDLSFIKYSKIEDYNNLVEELNKFPEEFIKNWLKKPDTLVKFNKLYKKSSKITKKTHSILEKLEVNKFDIFDEKNNTEFKNYITLFDEIENGPISISNIVSWIASEKNIKNTNLKKFYNLSKKVNFDINKLSICYRYLVRQSQRKAISQKYSTKIRSFQESKLRNLRRDLKNLDKEILEISRKEIERSSHKLGDIAAGKYPGNRRGKVSERTEMSLVQYAAKKTGTRISLRDAMFKAKNSITSLKPCTLMGPKSVSEILPLETIFDVVIIDEASQMKPEYSIGSIARSKQAVIVGDMKQLPPPRYFQSESDQNFDDDDYSESILDMAQTVLYPPKSLKWHYRSRHQDLIKFSNDKFYKNLLIPETPHDEEKKDLRGIKHYYVQDAAYLSSSSKNSKRTIGGINHKEASEIIDEIINFMHERPNESLGVVTMNANQANHIQELFDEAEARDPKIKKYIRNWLEKDDGLNEFFIKNLENVQGDERDVMMVGTLYGPSSKGQKVAQRFGMINQKNGERFLNVLLTRAKNQLILFTSLKPNDILINENSSQGVKVFKDYLTYAENPKEYIFEAIETHKEPDSPFEEWAIDQINSLPGFKAKSQIGSYGYYIDIVAYHDDYYGGENPVLAIETDGVTYHSTKSARDSDLVRQEILEGHGWHFHRIISTDWFNDPVGVKEKLKKSLNSRLELLINNINNEVETVSINNSNSSKEEIDQTINKNAEENNEKNYIEIQYQTCDLKNHMKIDQGLFYYDEYINELNKGISALINTEGPIEKELLIRKIREAHSFKKAGNPIRKVILNSIPNSFVNNSTKFENKIFYWPENISPSNWNLARYPSGQNRDITDLAPEEIYAIYKLIDNNSVELKMSEAYKEIVEFMGFSKTTSKMRNYIESSINEISNKNSARQLLSKEVLDIIDEN